MSDASPAGPAESEQGDKRRCHRAQQGWDTPVPRHCRQETPSSVPSLPDNVGKKEGRFESEKAEKRSLGTVVNGPHGALEIPCVLLMLSLSQLHD